MNEVELKALNEKLLLFAGFFKKKWIETEYWHLKTDYGDDVKFKTPNLVKCAELQIKYVYPKLSRLRIDNEGFNFGIQWDSDQQIYYAYIDNRYTKTFSEVDKNPTVAFALAVEKYIDSLEKK